MTPMRRSIATVGLVVFSLLAASGVGAAQSYSGSADSSTTAGSTTYAQVQDDQYTTQSEEDSAAGSSAEVDGSASAEISADGETEQDLREELDGLLNATQRLELEEDDQQEEESSTEDDEEQDADQETEENASSDSGIRTVDSGNGTIEANGSSSYDGQAEANGSADERDQREVDEPNQTDEDEEQDRNLSEQIEVREDESVEEDGSVKASSTMDALVEFRQNEPQIEHQADFEPTLFEHDVEQALHHEEQLGTEGGLSLNLGMSSAFSATSDGVQDSVTRVQGTVDRLVGSLNGLVGASASSSTEVSGQATSAVADDVTGDMEIASGGDGKVKTKVESTVERVQTPEVDQPEPKVESESSVQSSTEVSSSAAGSGGLDI